MSAVPCHNHGAGTMSVYVASHLLLYNMDFVFRNFCSSWCRIGKSLYHMCCEFCRQTMVMIISKEATGNSWYILNVILDHTFHPNSQRDQEQGGGA